MEHREESSHKELCVNAAHFSSTKKVLQKLVVKKAGGKEEKCKKTSWAVFLFITLVCVM